MAALVNVALRFQFHNICLSTREMRVSEWVRVQMNRFTRDGNYLWLSRALEQYSYEYFTRLNIHKPSNLRNQFKLCSACDAPKIIIISCRKSNNASINSIYNNNLCVCMYVVVYISGLYMYVPIAGPKYWWVWGKFAFWWRCLPLPFSVYYN